jgi:hypothetical protein
MQGSSLDRMHGQTRQKGICADAKKEVNNSRKQMKDITIVFRNVMMIELFGKARNNGLSSSSKSKIKRLKLIRNVKEEKI